MPAKVCHLMSSSRKVRIRHDVLASLLAVAYCPLQESIRCVNSQTGHKCHRSLNPKIPTCCCTEDWLPTSTLPHRFVALFCLF